MSTASGRGRLGGVGRKKGASERGRERHQDKKMEGGHGKLALSHSMGSLSDDPHKFSRESRIPLEPFQILLADVTV